MAGAAVALVLRLKQLVEKGVNDLLGVLQRRTAPAERPLCVAGHVPWADVCREG